MLSISLLPLVSIKINFQARGNASQSENIKKLIQRLFFRLRCFKPIFTCSYKIQKEAGSRRYIAMN